jgi:hypothetical protein
VLVLLFASTAVPAGAGTPGQTPAQPVYVIGDSVMLGAQGSVAAALAPVPTIVDAQESRSLLGAVSILQARRAQLGDVVVVALGTNDGTDTGEFAHRIDLAMGALQGVPHVLWVNQRQFAPGRAEMNAQLAAAVARYPNLSVLDWNAAVDANPGAVGPDGIHLTDTGRATMAALVADAVRRAMTPPTTTTSTTIAPTTTVATGRDRPGSERAGSERAGSERAGSERAGVRTRATGTDGSGDGLPTAWVAAGVVALVLAAGVVLAARRRTRS